MHHAIFILYVKEKYEILAAKTKHEILKEGTKNIYDLIYLPFFFCVQE
jgi:hypothetical protein